MFLRLERLLAMGTAIRSGSYPNVTAFMRRFEVSERTVHGDTIFRRSRLKTQVAFRPGNRMGAE
jgi:predicted DNA-binding transcriptional regulator YafY